MTFEQFVATVCANNYLDLVEKTNIKSKYEIYVSVMGITVEKTGVDPYEIGADNLLLTI